MAQYFKKGDLPAEGFARYEKTRLTPALRMEGTFVCETSEGNVVSCDDGWLAVDSHGHPYPVNDVEFQGTYRIVTDT